MNREKNTGGLGSGAVDEPQEVSPGRLKDEELQHAINNLTIEELEAMVRARGMENDPSIMRSLEGIRKGAKVDALERAMAENRDPSMEELEAAVLEIGMENDPEMVRSLERLRDMDKIVKAAALMIEAYTLLRELQKRGGEMEVEAVQGFLEMAELGIDGLGECSEQSRVSVAETKTSWPLMMEGNGTKAIEAAQAGLEKLKLGSKNSSEVRINAVVTAASRHKFVATLLYWTVRSVFNLDRLSRTVKEQPIRMAHLKEDMAEKFKMLMQFVNGYEANDWRAEDMQHFVKKLKALHACPEVNAASFNEWFAACLALLDCITHGEFHHARYELRNLGEARAQEREGIDGKKDSDYRDGITSAMKSALKTVLKISRKKVS